MYKQIDMVILNWVINKIFRKRLQILFALQMQMKYFWLKCAIKRTKCHTSVYCILTDFSKLFFIIFIQPSHGTTKKQCFFSPFQLPCDENWKREELKRYLLRSPILQWEGSPIQHMGQPAYVSLVHISNTQRQVSEINHRNTHDSFYS